MAQTKSVNVATEHAHTIHLRDLNPISVLAIGGLHVGCLLAPFTFTWGALGVAVLLWWATGALGICLCYHRLLTHRSFKTPKAVEYALTVLGTLNWQGGPMEWVGTHRLHHAHSETDEDPHSPRHGFNWSHALWCLVKHNDYDPCSAARDLARDPVMVLLDRYHYVPQALLAALLFALGGWPWVVWGVCVRVVFTYHATWFVNSAAHTWGYRNFETDDDSRNNWWVSVLAFGEGWHNNHHALQRSARHGMRWWEIDLTYLTIQAMSLVGLAWSVVTPDIRARLAADGPARKAA